MRIDAGKWEEWKRDSCFPPHEVTTANVLSEFGVEAQVERNVHTCTYEGQSTRLYELRTRFAKKGNKPLIGRLMALGWDMQGSYGTAKNDGYEMIQRMVKVVKRVPYKEGEE